MVYIYDGILFSHKKEILPFKNLDGPWRHYANECGISQTEKDKYCMIFVESKKLELIDTKIRLVVARGVSWELE